MPNFVYDRTASDVANKTAKGYINSADLNRIGDARTAIYNLLKEAGYYRGSNLAYSWPTCPAYTTDSYYTANYFVPANAILTDLYITRVRALYDSFYVTAMVGRQVSPYMTVDAITGAVSNLPTTFKFATYQTFNNEEKVLYDMYMLAKSIIDNFRECDTFYCGE